MKEDHKSLYHFLTSKNSITRVSIFLILFFVGFGFGYFTAPRSPAIANNTVVRPSTPRPQTHPPIHDLLQFASECAPPIPQSSVLPTLKRKIFNSTSPFFSFPPPQVSPFLHRRRVRGWGSTGSVFETLIKSVLPSTIIEVGTFLGASALHMANLTRHNNLPDTLIVCLDDFRGWPGFRDQNRGIFKHLVDINGDVILLQQFMQNVVDANEQHRVVPVPFSTTSALTALCQWGVYADLVEVDAGHDFHSAWADINLAWKVVRPGGVMFGHDYNLRQDNMGVRRAVNLFAKVKGLSVRRDGQHWVISPPKQQQHMS